MNYSHFRDLSLNAFEMIEALMLWEWTNEKLNLKQAIKITKDIQTLEIDDWVNVIERGGEKRIKLILEMIKIDYAPIISSNEDVKKILEAIEDTSPKEWRQIVDYIKKIDAKRIKNLDGYHFFARLNKGELWYEIKSHFLMSIMQWKPWEWLAECWFPVLVEPMLLCKYQALHEWFNIWVWKKYLNEDNNDWTWVYLFDLTILALAYAWVLNHKWLLKKLKEIYFDKDNVEKLWYCWLGDNDKIYQVLKAKKLLFDDYKWDNSVFWENVLHLYYEVTWNKDLIFRFLVALAHYSDDYYELISETLDKFDFKKSIKILQTHWHLVSKNYDTNKYESNKSQQLLMDYLVDCDFVKDLEKYDKRIIDSFISWYLFLQDAKTLRKFFPKIEEKDDNLFMLKLIELYDSDNFNYYDVKQEIQKNLLSEETSKDKLSFFQNRIEEIRKESSSYKRFLSWLESEWLLKFLNFEEEREQINFVIQKIINPTKKEIREMATSPIPIVSKQYVIDIFWILMSWDISKENWESLSIDWYNKKISAAEYMIRYCKNWYIFTNSNNEVYCYKYFEIFEYLDQKGLIWEKEILAVKELFERNNNQFEFFHSKTKTWKPRLNKYEKLLIEKINEFFTKHNIKDPETKEEFVEKTVQVLKKQFWEDKVFLNDNNNIEIKDLDDLEKLKTILSKIEYL